MKTAKLSDMTRGWFIGDFDQAVVRTKDFEVCYQENSELEDSQPHYHKVITEIQLIVRGHLRVNGVDFLPGDICYLEPGEHYHSEFVEPTDVVAIKFPSVPGDKYLL